METFSQLHKTSLYNYRSKKLARFIEKEKNVFFIKLSPLTEVCEIDTELLGQSVKL